MTNVRTYASALLLAVLPGCADAPESAPDRTSETAPREADQAAFWSSLQAMCGRAFDGWLVESVPADGSFQGRKLVMHVRQCSDEEIRIPFHVGDDRSRTWVLTRTADGLRLKHDHRHEDGSEDEVTQYGGDTRGPGTATTQEFHADAFTAELLPASATNIWTIEVLPDGTFAYALRREGTERRFRVEFDLMHYAETPPPPWGADPAR